MSMYTPFKKTWTIIWAAVSLDLCFVRADLVIIVVDVNKILIVCKER